MLTLILQEEKKDKFWITNGSFLQIHTFHSMKLTLEGVLQRNNLIIFQRKNQVLGSIQYQNVDGT
jgi:hypothetical protein